MLVTYLRWAYRGALALMVLGAPVVILVAFFAMHFAPRMRETPRLKPYENSEFFEDHRSVRTPPRGTVARGQRVDDAAFYWGRNSLPDVAEPLQLLPLEARPVPGRRGPGSYVEWIPIKVTEKTLRRGQERFDIYCAPCHGRAADGQGIIPQHGFPHPPTLHSTRLREAPAGYYFNVITLGYGMMFDYADRIHPADRWAIVAYIRALQLSARAPVEALDSSDIERLKEASP